MQSSSPTKLDYAILGLLRFATLSGYQIRQIFENSEMGNYSSSPGSIYPALNRIVRLELVELVSQKRSEKKERKVYALTETGWACLLDWLQQDVRPEDVYRHMDELLLKFAFMDVRVEKTQQLRFLRQIEALLPSKIAELEELCEDKSNKITFNGRLALRHGLEVYRAHYRWVKNAQQVIENSSST